MARRKREQSNEPVPKSRLTEQQLNVFGEIFTGFDSWYRANHDEAGRYVGEKLPGLKPPVPSEQDRQEEQEWHDIISKPHVRAAVLRLADEALQQEAAGETEECGFGGE